VIGVIRQVRQVAGTMHLIWLVLNALVLAFHRFLLLFRQSVCPQKRWCTCGLFAIFRCNPFIKYTTNQDEKRLSKEGFVGPVASRKEGAPSWFQPACATAHRHQLQRRP
jgi:hypothetical protein